MGIGILIVIAAAVFIAWSIVKTTDLHPAGSVSAVVRSPLDEAERILSARYARGDITPDEYRRMLVILRA
jgi:uncharacterized membrane protein